MKISVCCKVCGGRLIDADSTIKLLVFDASKRADRKADFYAKCGKCKCQNGIIKL